MKAKDLSNLYWFCQSVEHGGFAAASEHNRASAPTLSRALSQLEEQAGEKLVHRHAKQFLLTKAGEEYYQRFAGIFQQLDEQWLALSNTQSELVGDIVVSCPEPFADYFLQQIAIEFMAQHPQVNVHIRFASDTEHFFDEQIDLAVVTSPPHAPNLVQRRLFESQLSLAASPEYVAKHGAPTTLQDLDKHQLLAGNTLSSWDFKLDGEQHRVQLKPKYSINSLRLVIQAACAGLGICLIPKATLRVFEQRHALQPILPDAQCPSGSAYLVWSDRKLISARVAALRDQIFEKMSQPEAFLATISD